LSESLFFVIWVVVSMLRATFDVTCGDVRHRSWLSAQNDQRWLCTNELV